MNFVGAALQARLGIVAIAQKAPLALQFFTGLYLFVLPYATRWRSARYQLNAASPIKQNRA